ncbi:hypothetical protein C8R41DRAFT_919803 [Lentinula lateritia]|uniref:DUF6830 domain-containing protein n=1 Tax=Lentinula lateritia TaxID=40482 RepID=A0ABQ8VKW7_9AGAR|nr:hypothetical protein C8R41DRAFT_919803 [Lentinula lateritia]
MSFSCPYCGHLYKTEAGRRSHVKQTLCNYKPGLVPLSTLSSLFSSTSLSSISPSSPPPPSSNSELDPWTAEENFMDVDQAETDSGPYQIPFPNASQIVGQGATFMDDFNDDRFADERGTNLYYPFASRPEWETASFLLNSSLSMQEIDIYLKLDLTKKNNLSFQTAQRLHDLADLLPPVASWKSRNMKTLPLYSSKTPLVLYYRDAIEVLQDLMKSPLICDSLHFTPMQIFEDSRKLVRVYDSWLSGDRAWKMQSQYPEGATLLGVVLSSDKTTVSVITVNRVAHPLLISLANIDSDLLSKASLHLFCLLALLPVPKYIERKTSIRFTARIGCMMSDPVGQLRVCYTPLASAIVDTPEASLIACTSGKDSPFTETIYKNYGDSLRHPSRLSSTTLDAIDSIQARNIFPQDLPVYQRAAVTARTNGVVYPFWRDWALAEPCEFLMPEPLHHWHKMFWDHDAKWAIQAVGASHIDFRFSIHQPTVGYRHFQEGISSLKQVTGRTHRDIQRYLIPVISGAISAKFVTALRALLDFRYSGQAQRFSQTSSLRVQTALKEFHENKSVILELKARVNPKGKPIDHWEIPKLEFMQNVEPSIHASGPIMQWTADITEHAHITLVKDPARSGNNHDFEIQICRSLDRLDRVRRFDLMTAMKDASVDFRLEDVEGDEGQEQGAEGLQVDEEEDTELEITKISSTEKLVTHLNPVSKKLFRSFRPKQNFFLKARLLKRAPSAPLPHRSFVDNVTGEISAFSLVRDPDLKTQTIEEASRLYSLSDFHGACSDLIDRIKSGTKIFTVGGRRTGNTQSPLPFYRVKLWSRLRIQCRTYFNLDLLTDPHTIFSAPPGPGWEFGRQNAVIVNIDQSFQWPRSSLEGHAIVLVKMIFTVAQPRRPSLPIEGTHCFLAYWLVLFAIQIIPQDVTSLRELGEQMGLLWEILFLFHNSVLLQIFVLSIEEILTLL